MVITITLITALTFVASLIGLVTGFGTGTYMAPLILLGIPYKKSLFFVCIIHWFHNIWKTGFFIRSINIPLLIYFGLPAIVASYGGALIVISESSESLAQTLGVFLILYSLFLLLNPTFIIPATKTSAFIGGTISGFLAGVFGMRGAIKSSFLSTYDLSPEHYLATTGAISFFIDTIRIITYWNGGITLSPLLHWSLLFAIPVSYIGALIGSRFVLYIPREKFRSFIAVSLLVAGVWILIVMQKGMLL